MTPVFFKVGNNNILQAAKIFNEDLDKINAWNKKWLVYINTTNTIFVFFSKKHQLSNVSPLLGNGSLSKVNEHKHLILLFTPLHVCMHTYIHTYIYTYIHTYIIPSKKVFIFVPQDDTEM